MSVRPKAAFVASTSIGWLNHIVTVAGSTSLAPRPGSVLTSCAPSVTTNEKLPLPPSGFPLASCAPSRLTVYRPPGSRRSDGVKTRSSPFQARSPDTSGAIAKRSSTSARSMSALNETEIAVVALTSLAMRVGGCEPASTIDAAAASVAAVSDRTDGTSSRATAVAAARSSPARRTWKSVTAGAVWVVKA